jgi:hypothetical protein
MASVLKGFASSACNVAYSGYEKVRCGKREDAEAPKQTTAIAGGDSYFKRATTNETTLRAARTARAALSWLPVLGKTFERAPIKKD